MDWIDVLEKIPENNTPVLILTEKKRVLIAYLNLNNKWAKDDSCIFCATTYNITHWMPIPNIPEKMET